MVSRRTVPAIATHTVRVVGLVVAYAMVLVTGTALFMAALGSHDGSRELRADPQRLASDQQLLQHAERGVQSPEAFLLASRNIPNDRRGY